MAKLPVEGNALGGEGFCYLIGQMGGWMKNIALAVALAATGLGFSAAGASANTIALALGEVDTAVNFKSGQKIDADYGFVVSSSEAFWQLSFSFSNNAPFDSHSYPYGRAMLEIFAGATPTGTPLYTGTAVQTNIGTPAHPSYVESIAVNDGATFDLAAGSYNVLVIGSTNASKSGTGTLAATATAVPEISTWAMMLAGFAGLGLVGFARNNKARILEA